MACLFSGLEKCGVSLRSRRLSSGRQAHFSLAPMHRLVVREVGRGETTPDEVECAWLPF